MPRKIAVILLLGAAGLMLTANAGWLNNELYTGTGTLRDIAIGTGFKDATDDSVRAFTVQSGSPYKVLLLTDTSSVSSVPMKEWRVDVIEEPYPGCRGAAVGDVDGDGLTDLVYGQYNVTSLAWVALKCATWNTGTESWDIQDIASFYVGSNVGITDIAIGDADNDTHADEIIYTFHHTVRRAHWNGSSWDDEEIWAGDGSACYGVAIGDFDPTRAGNEVAAVTLGPYDHMSGTYLAGAARLWWNSVTPEWEINSTLFPVDMDFFDVACGDFDPTNAGAELAVNNGRNYDTEGAIIELYIDGTGTWNRSSMYAPASGWGVQGEIAIGDFCDVYAGNEVVATSGTGNSYEARAVWYTAFDGWVDEQVLDVGATTYGAAVGDMNKYRTYNSEIAVTGNNKVYEVEQFGAPEVPVLISPPDLAINQPVDGQLVWGSTGGASSYNVFLDIADPPLIEVSHEQTSTTYDYTGLSNNVLHYWQVVAVNVVGSTPSDIWEFTTKLWGDPDIGVTAISAPKGWVHPAEAVIPKATVHNHGNVAWDFDVWFIINDPLGAEDYREKLENQNVPVGNDAEMVFPEWPGSTDEGPWTTRCSVYVAGDVAPSNDFLDGSFVVSTSPPWPDRWHEVTPMPSPPSQKAVKRGGWLAFNEANGLVYAAKGYKTTDFYSYDAVSDSWTERSGMPYLTHSNPKWARKVPRKGSKGVCDNNHYVYVTQGNNTLGFWRYDIAGDSWDEMSDVPLGRFRKKVKGGTDLAYVTLEDTGYVYLLKGYKTEFYRFNVETGKWDTLPEAPEGSRAKWDKGSWIVYNEADGTYDAKLIYAHKAKYHDGVYHELWKYDIPGDSWFSHKLKGMPLEGLHSGRLKRKKSKDGGCGAWYQGFIYALKGGNTQQFFKYGVAGDSWTELDTVPNYSSTAGRKRRVKYGADIVSYGTGAFFALKGNKTRDLWRYVIPFAFADVPARSGVMAGRVETARYKVTIAPNPLAGGFATLRYTLPMAGPARISVFDVVGRVQNRRTLLASRSGAVSLDLRNLSAGVYLVRFDADGFTATSKLVVQH